MPSAPWVAVLLVLAQLCATIEVTNEDFNVQRGVGFEVRWKDAEDANVVDISLWKFPVYRYVETLDSRVNNQSLAIGSRSGNSKVVFVPDDLEPREYCFRVVRWPAGEYDWSDGFFFNGTGERESETTTTSESTAIETSTISETPVPSETGLRPGDDNDGRPNDTTPPLNWVRRPPLSPMLIALVILGGLVVIAVVFGCVYWSIRDRKKKKAQGLAEAEGTAEGTTPQDGQDQTVSLQPANVEASGSGAEKEGAQSGEIREFYAPPADERPKGHQVREYYASGALRDGGTGRP